MRDIDGDVPWNRAQQRGAGFALYILQRFGVYPILANLHESGPLRRADLMRLLSAANLADAPLAGAHAEVSAGLRGTLRNLRRAGLIVRTAGATRGAHPRYSITGFGEELLESVDSLSEWGLANFDLLVAATRPQRGLDPLAQVPSGPRTPRAAAGMTLGVLEPRWSFTILVNVAAAGPEGIRPSELLEQINLGIDTSPEPVQHRLTRESKRLVLAHLVDAGLLEKQEMPNPGSVVPTPVFYRVTAPGAELAAALERVAVRGMEQEKRLLEIMKAASTWFVPPEQSGQ